MTRILVGILIVAVGLFLSTSTVLSQLPCPADLDCDGDVDAEDASTFLQDFGRSRWCGASGAGFLCDFPCTNEYPCPGDFDCDTDIDSSDLVVFLEDFGRNQFNNPCPPCVAGCEYP